MKVRLCPETALRQAYWGPHKEPEQQAGPQKAQADGGEFGQSTLCQPGKSEPSPHRLGPCPNGRGRASPAMPGMWLQHTPWGERAACCPGFAWKGVHADRLGRGLLCSLPSAVQVPLLPVAQNSCQGQPQLRRGKLGEYEGRRQLLCARSSSHLPSYEPRCLFKEMSNQTPELLASG